MLAVLVLLAGVAALATALAPMAGWWSEPDGATPPGPSPTGFEAMAYEESEFPLGNCPIDDVGGDVSSGCAVFTGGLPLLTGVLVVALAIGPAASLWRRSSARKSMVVGATVVAAISAAGAWWTWRAIDATPGPGMRVWLATSTLALACLGGCLGLAASMARRHPAMLLLWDTESRRGQAAEWLWAAAVTGSAALVVLATAFEPLAGFVVAFGLLAGVFVALAVRTIRSDPAAPGGRRCPYCDVPLHRWARRCRNCHMRVLLTP